MLPIVLAAQSLSVPLQTGQVIARATRFQPGDYLVVPTGEERGAIQIRGDNLVLDFAGVIQRGSPATVEPDERKGVGLEVTGRNVTIKNLTVRGYKIGLLARNAPGLRLVNVDGSYNWRQRLKSTTEREDLADWMSYHQNEKDEWKRYGAAFYLRECDGAEVKGCRVTGGQNGLMITSTDKALIWNNDFSYNSSLGLGMYRSSDNRVMHNRMDYNLRGFSYGKYNRGQDSAGILIYEQSNRNVFAYNSVTHSGDGFFLWAGQTTMDTGKGGCNDNLLYANDFSHAPTNGIEATFSRNRFVNNLLLECWHGVWGGYSYDTAILGNVFGHNAEGIAIEHGQSNVIAGNVFHRDNEAIYLWANDRAPDPNWGYPKFRDTRSMGYAITKNRFGGHPTSAIRLVRTLGAEIRDNSFEANGTNLVLGEGTEGVTGGANRVTAADAGFPAEVRDRLLGGLTLDANQVVPSPASALNQGDVSDYALRWTAAELRWNPFETPATLQRIKRVLTPREQFLTTTKEGQDWVAPLKGGMDPFLKPGAPRGWRTMFVDEWGPVDGRTPRLVGGEVVAMASSISGEPDAVPYQTTTRRFTILGPAGRWQAESVSGACLSAQAGTVPGEVEITTNSVESRVDVKLTYSGEATTDYRGVVTSAGKPVSFGWSEFRAPILWNVKAYAWDETLDANDPNRHPKNPFTGAPIKEWTTGELDYATGGAFFEGGPRDQFATTAEGTVELPPGEYILDLTADDGIRVYVDGQRVLDEWHYQGPTPYAVLLTGGKHTIKIEHFEINGYAALQAKIRPK